MMQILTDLEWKTMQKISDEMKMGKFAYVLPGDLDKLGYQEKQK